MPRQLEVGVVALGLPKCYKPSGGSATMIGCAVAENGDLQHSFVFIQETIERYRSHTRIHNTPTTSESAENTQRLKEEVENMMKRIDLLEISKRKLLGGGLGSCSIDELQRMEQQLDRSITKIRVKKAEVFEEQIDQLKEKEKTLFAENTRLSEKYGSYSSQQAKKDDRKNIAEAEPILDVETELFIGLPATRTR
ncbi:MADS-box protein soc1, variant 3 [Lathyrus oleraceus]|uniref:MADS-box protein soc1, variant 3 n=1 Tax=Pisum sativum TaxID=3888 RepID=A0A9D4XI29_PEA|nr:MADS-box protein soc1, variant 3 [Pisum sativum]